MKQSLTKRVISMLITVAMLLTMVPSVFAANPDQFKDFPKGWSKVAMEFSVDNGLLNGKSANTIEPMANLTRAEMATIINRAFGAKITKDISAYTDVDKSDWYYTEMQKAVNMQTFQGDGNGKLRPDDAITREEVMTVIARAIVLETDDYSSISKFKDYSSVSEWAKPYVAVLIANGYVNGYEDNTVKPKANITREEFAQLMYNIFKTYLSAKDTSYTSVFDKNCVMINNEGINLSNVTIDGDLVLGDGVGTSKINLTNVTIKGRLLARGGIITLKNVTTGKGVVVKNVNGTTHFNNYRADVVFNGVKEYTYTTYLTPSFVSGGGRPSETSKLVSISIIHPGGTKQVKVPSGTTISDLLKDAEIDIIDVYENNGNKYNVDWFVDDGTGKKPLDKDAQVTKDIKITYELSAPVTVDNDNGTVINTTVKVDPDNFTLDLSDLLKDANKPTKDNYDFVGWFDANGKEYTKDTSDAKTSPLKIKARWEAKKYTLTLKTNGGTFVPGYVVPNQYKYDEDIVLPGKNELKRDNYILLGWVDNPAGTGVPVFIIPAKSISGDKTYYAVWEEITPGTVYYTISIDRDGDGVIDSVFDVKENETIPNQGTPTKEGWKFEYWTADGVNEYDFDTPVTGPVTLIAVFTKIHKVTFKYGNGDFDKTVDVLDGEKAVKPANPTWAGHMFKFWSLDGVNEYDFATPVTGPITLTAVWETVAPVKYQVRFVYGNGQADKYVTVVKGDVVTKPQNPTREGYVFEYWSFDGINEYDFSTPIINDITLIAVWTVAAPVTYEVTFVYDNGQPVGKSTVIKGQPVAKPQDPTKDGHTFKYWSLDGVNEYDFTTPVTGDIVLTALWEVVVPPVTTYEVTFVYGNGQADGKATVEKGKAVDKPADPTWEGYTFKFWSLDGTTEYDFATAVTSDITLTAVWEAVVPPVTTYEVTFVYGNGQADGKATVEKGKAVDKPADPTWDGYKFQFWTLDGTTEYNFATPVNSDITLTAVWTKIHTVTFVYGNGQPDKTEKVLNGDKVAKPADPVWEGHQFKFWTADGTTEYDFDTAIRSDMTITASWTGVHIVTFKYDNGDADTTQNVLDGEKAVKPADPTRENYTFEFWSLDGVTEYDFDTPVTGPITLTAIWKVIDTTIIHTVKFYAFPQGTAREKFAGELEIVSGNTFGTEADGTISDKVKTIYREKQSDGESRYELWDFTNPTGASNMVVKGYFDAAENFQHYIRPDLVYLKNGKWASFTGDTVVTSDMEVYAVRRRVELYMEGSILGISLPDFGATIKTPYNAATRAVDSLKDALWLSRDSFEKVFTDKFQSDIFAKLAPKSKGFIDSDGYIQNKEFSMKIADVISSSDIEKEIRKYIEDIFNGDNAKLKEIIETIGVETLVRKIGIKSLVENIGYDEVRNALTDSSNRAMLISYIRDLLKTDKDFRNMLIEDKDFMESVLNDMKEEVINEIVSDTDFIINILESDQEIKGLFVDSAMENTKFLKDVLTSLEHKDEIIYLIHNEEKQELIDILDDADVKAEIVGLLRNDPDFMDKLDNDEEFKNFVVDAIHDSIDLSAMFDDETIDAMLDELQGNSDFEEFKKDIVVDLNTDSFKKEVIDSVRTNKSVVEAIVGELAGDSEFKKTLISNLTNDDDLKTTLVEAAIDNQTTKKQIVEKISSETSFKKEVLAEISNDISEFSVKIVDNIKDEPQFRQSVIDSVIVVESGEIIRNDALIEMIDVLKNETSIVNYVKSSAQTIIDDKVPVGTPVVTDDEAISIIDAYIDNDYNVVIGGHDIDISEIESDIDEYIIELAADYKNYVSDKISVYSKPVAEVDDHITDVINAYIDGTDDTLTADIEEYVSDIIDAYNDESVYNEMETEIDKYINDAVDSYINGSGGEYDSVIDDYIDDIKANYKPSATTGIDGKINEYINDAINDYVSGVSTDLTSEIEDFIVDALNDFDAHNNTGVNGVINTNINSILDDYISGTTTAYTQYINDYIDEVVNDFASGNQIDQNIKEYIDSHMKDYIKESIEKYSNQDPSLNQDVHDYIDEKLPEFLFDHIRDYFHGTLAHDVIEDTIENVIVDFVKMYINEDPHLTNKDVIDLIEDNMVDYIIEQLTTEDENRPDKVKDFVVHTKTNFANKLKEEDISLYADYIEQYIESDKDNVKEIIRDNYAEIVEYVLDNVNNSDINEYLHEIIIDKASTLSDSLINSYIDDNINDILTDEFIAKYIDTHENDEELINMVLNYLTSDKIVEYINTIREKDRQNNTNELGKFIDEAVKVFKDMDFYKSLIACLDSKAPTYKVTNENIYFMEAIGDAIGRRSFEDALDLLGAGKVKDALVKLNDMTGGEISTLYYEATQSFSKGLDEVKVKIDADSSYTEDYPMSLGVKIDFASIIAKYYTKLHDKVTDKVNSVAPYYYTENQYLQEFIDGICVDSYLEYNPAVVSEVNSGYKFKTIMEYYDLMYNNLLLIDKAVLWYGPNTPEEFENLRDDIANDIITGFDKLQSILENLDEEGKIFGSYTIKDVIARVDTLKKVGETVPQLNAVIDNVCKILSKVEGGEVIAKGYTLDDLVELSERLDKAVATLRDEEYEKLNSELESLIDKTITRIDEIINELDKDGTILGKVSIDDLVSKVDAINNIYAKFEGKIDDAFSKLADIEKGSVSGKLDTEYWEDILFGEDDYNRFDLDDIFDVACPKLDKFRVKDPYTDSNKRLVIDEFKVKGAGATVTFDRYLD